MPFGQINEMQASTQTNQIVSKKLKYHYQSRKVSTNQIIITQQMQSIQMK